MRQRRDGGNTTHARSHSTPRIVVVGAGPTGLGAAHRLHELGFDDYVVLETDVEVGGLARSFVDDAGFTYDIGGHVLFSHYPYYDRVIDAALADEYTWLDRQAWVWMEERFIPYPFQNNIKDLEPSTVFECVIGLIEAQREPAVSAANFAEWMEQVFGAGMTKHFMRPYNLKVWATPPELMSYAWIAERVSVVDTEEVLRGIIYDEPVLQWGPNDRFRYPLRGGTGTVCRKIAAPLLDNIRFASPVVAVDPGARVVHTADGRRWEYDLLLSTMPLNLLIAKMEQAPDSVRRSAAELVSTGSHIVGIAVDRPAGIDKNWIYFPEPTVPFHRVTYLSNYSPYMTAEPDQTLLLAETSWSAYKPSGAEAIVDDVIDGLVQTGLMTDADRSIVVARWLHSAEMSYPVPTLGRDAALGTVHPWLREQGIWSRGRFGAWVYEIGNIDHSFMQGVEWVDHVLRGDPETTWTAPRRSGRRTGLASTRR